MAEYINREEALTWFKAYLHTGEDSIPTDTVLEDLRYAIPKVDVVPVRHGHWVDCEDEYSNYVRCSVCGDEYTNWEADCARTNFCPNCGAKMDLGGADN